MAKKRKYVIRTQFSELPQHKGESNTLPSMTQPDMSLTVKQLLTNHTRNLHTQIVPKQEAYFDMEIPRFDDITEAEAWKQSLIDRAAAIDEEVVRIQKEKEEEKRLKLEEERLKALKDIPDEKE